MTATRPRWIAFEGADDEVLAEIAGLELEDASGGEQTWLDGENFGGLEPEADVEAELFDTELPRASRPPTFYVTITEKLPNTKMQGDVVAAPHAGKIAGINFHFGVVSPRDVASGAASGSLQHSAVTMTKEWTPTSPLLLDALVRNSTLPKVVFEFVSGQRTSAEKVFQKLTLTNAVVTSLRQVVDGERLIEEVAFTFQTIELENVARGTRAQFARRGSRFEDI